ncbi:uncharacterized protein LOC590810 [Strongylocentrotus purpuratus]|uniref:Lysosome-associated membrane glycoprotein 5 n=1 Tax=Strongylocentrotus purpuratus TaxID=7668 RepID=A0A7M7RHM9_STRPU|nr:uncharacterized protein LOC590810 [Strongylocentrotus purpuratus]
MEGPSLLILLVVWVAFTSAATTVNPSTGIVTGISTEIITEVGTTIIDNSTTRASSTEPQPTPCADATWMVRQTDGNICMLMSFTGTITYQGSNNAVKVDIPETALPATSACSENSALFTLSFPSGENIWQIQLSFNTEGGKYYLSRVSFDLMTLEGVIIDTQNVEKEFFSVPLGEHYRCDTVAFDLGTALIELSSPILQPFVQATGDGCGLGGAHECNSGESSGSNTGLIVGCCIAGIAGVALGGFTFYIVRKRKKNNYSNIR